jgi:hypothetical protein
LEIEVQGYEARSNEKWKAELTEKRGTQAGMKKEEAGFGPDCHKE